MGDNAPRRAANYAITRGKTDISISSESPRASGSQLSSEHGDGKSVARDAEKVACPIVSAAILPFLNHGSGET